MSKFDKDRLRNVQNKCQEILNLLLKDEDNKYCVDCDAKGPRWASWNIGIFLCIRCAGIHRNLGVHISKVKSVNLDSWTPEQVAMLEQMGNSKARAIYEANLPDNFRRPQTDSSLESFIRAKYEMKRYIAKEWTPSPALKFPQMWDMEEDKKKDKKSVPKLKAIELIDTSKSDKLLSSGNFTNSVTSQPKSSSSSSSNIANLLELDLTPSPSDTFGQFESALPIPTPAEQCAPKGNDAIFQLDTCPPTLLTDTGSATLQLNNNLTALEPSPNQAPLTVKENTKDNKLTKDSILALYNQSNINLPMHSGTRPQGVYPSSNYQFGIPPIGQNQTCVPPQPTYSLPPDHINNPFLTGSHNNLPNSNSYPFISPGFSSPGTANMINPNTGNIGNPMGTMLGPLQTARTVQPDPFNQMHQQFSSLDLLSSNTPSNNFLGKGLPHLPANHPTQQQTPGASGHSLTTNMWQ